MNHLPARSPPLIVLVSDPEPRAESQPSCFSPASLCTTDWPVVSTFSSPSHTDNYSSEPTLIFLLWEQGSSFIPTKNTAASRIKCRHCGNPGLAVSTWLNKKWRELRRWSTSCCRADFDLLLYCQVRMFLNCTTLHLKHKMTFHRITKKIIWMIL